MRNTHAMRFGLFLGAVAVAQGCNGPEVGSSQARLVLSAQGSGPATLHVTGADDANASVVLDRTLQVQENSATLIDLTVAPASYTFSVDVLGGASGAATIGSGSVHADLKDGATTQIALTALLDAQTGNGSAEVQVGVDAVPKIQAVDVQVSGSGAEATAQVHVTATDTEGGALAFFWSGAGLQGAVQGSSTLTLPTATLAASATAPVLHVVVQDQQGAAASADIALSLGSSGVQGTLSGGSGASADACLQAQAQCCATCAQQAGVSIGGLSSDATCVAACGVSLATCQPQ